MTNLDLGVYNICLVNCNTIFNRYAADAIVDELYKFNLLEKSLSNPNNKRIFYHYTIFNFCEAILKNKSNKKSILFFNNTQLEESSLEKYYTPEDIIKNICYVLNKMKRILPVKIYISRYSLPYFDHLLKNRQGRVNRSYGGRVLRSELGFATSCSCFSGWFAGSWEDYNRW